MELPLKELEWSPCLNPLGQVTDCYAQLWAQIKIIPTCKQSAKGLKEIACKWGLAVNLNYWCYMHKIIIAIKTAVFISFIFCVMYTKLLLKQSQFII